MGRRESSTAKYHGQWSNSFDLSFGEQAGNVSGKIVVYNQPWSDRYGDIVVYRKIGPSRASQLGAVAALTRSLTDQSLDTLHTGSTVSSQEPEVR